MNIMEKEKLLQWWNDNTKLIHENRGEKTTIEACRV